MPEAGLLDENRAGHHALVGIEDAEPARDRLQAITTTLQRQSVFARGTEDRDAFRAMANRVKEKTGQKGKTLFHPIRVALTGEGGGPELDLAVPAIDRGAQLSSEVGLARILSARERAKAFAAAIS